MASRNYLFFCSFFIFLFWAGATKEENENELQDSSVGCDSPSSIICGVPAGENCLGDSCYTFNTDRTRTWKDARDECNKSNNGDLVSIETKEELVYLQEKIKKLNLQHHKEWYIGLSVKGSLWEWFSGKPLTINHWYNDEPSNYFWKEDIVYISRQPPAGGFGDYYKKYPRGAICETKRVSNGKYCYDTSCYTFLNREQYYDVHRKQCKKLGGDLVSLETECEWAYITKEIRRQKVTGNHSHANDDWFIGLSRKPLTSWKWVNSASNSFDKRIWTHTYPRGRSPYVSMGIAALSKNPERIFKDALSACDEKPFICEKKIEYHPPT
ncbi:C-type mannose receptor 2-like [Actinia tenebrosa]|uniref:C-type mannose receptor 2-like n=1 Tax=Actinia tenebrosa TaxID=6105 RepID=A0A6P8IC09_ACTTE|nr:C-type mannose receptor 2-like [Actinia tenebrosa]